MFSCWLPISRSSPSFRNPPGGTTSGSPQTHSRSARFRTHWAGSNYHLTPARLGIPDVCWKLNRNWDPGFPRHAATTTTTTTQEEEEEETTAAVSFGDAKNSENQHVTHCLLLHTIAALVGPFLRRAPTYSFEKNVATNMEDLSFIIILGELYQICSKLHKKSNE